MEPDPSLSHLTLQPLEIFCAYADSDLDLVKEFLRHLVSLERSRLIKINSELTIPPGTNKQEIVNRFLQRSHLILCFISAEFLNSSYFSNRVFEDIIRARPQDSISIIPLILRPCSLSMTCFANAQYLPRTGKAIVSWGNRDQAWLEVVKELHTTIRLHALKRSSASKTGRLGEEVIKIATNATLAFIKIAGESYAMGNDLNQGNSSEHPRHEVTLDSYYIAETQTTQQQFELVMGKNPSRFIQKANPVECISWLDAIMFCNELSIQQGLTPAYILSESSIRSSVVTWQQSSSGYRLPTEAEWEHCCRAGTSTNYSCGDNLNQLVQVAWFQKNSQGATHPVGELKSNHWGLFDMHGQVYEWVWDWFDSNWYKNSPTFNPTGPLVGSARVLRGGSWSEPANRIRSAYRIGSRPDTLSPQIGFRVARSAR